MKKAALVILSFLFLSGYAIAQLKPAFTGKDIQYSFDRSDALAVKKDLSVYYVYCYAGTKSGWNAKTKEYYPVQDKIVYSKIFRLTNVPVPQIYRPGETGNVANELAKLFLKHLIATAGFNEEINYATWIGDYDLAFVEKKIEETMTGYKKDNAKLKFVYNNKFSFDYSDTYYKTAYKAD
ncbi:MAG: hypothetical protein JWR72_1183 [Flavisolibacter sp.]|jgi:hypothetical protein|nr:hypothetical protein [Flavisolibacter sp.]